MGKKNNESREAPTQYDKAETVEELANRLIAKYHSHLASCKIAYLYKNKDMKAKGKVKVATAEKCSPKVKALTDYDFLIVVSYAAYNSLTDKQKRAVIDHELEHCWVEEDEETSELKFSILSHDVEEFGSIIRRHGLYFSDLEKLGRIVKETKDEEEDDEEPVVKVKKHSEDNVVSLKKKKLLKKSKHLMEDFLPMD